MFHHLVEWGEGWGIWGYPREEPGRGDGGEERGVYGEVKNNNTQYFFFWRTFMT
jgi:hypothetical protein